MASVIIPAGLSFVTWTGPATPLAQATWIGNVAAVYNVSVDRRGFISYTQIAAYPDFLQLTPTSAGSAPQTYLFRTTTAFQLDGALVGIVVAATTTPAPTITAVSPSSGAVGSSVTIAGTAFGASAGTSGTVKFNGLLAYPTTWSDTSITVPVPTGATSGVVAVTTAGGTATSTSSFTVTATAGVGGVAANDAVIIFINGQSNAQGNAEASEVSFAPMDTFSPAINQSFAMTKIWNVANNVFENMVVGTNTRSDATNTYPQGYTYAAKSDGTWDVGNAAAKYNITGVGPEYGIADAYRSLNPVTPIYIIKFCEGGTSINVWQKGNATGLYAKLLAHKNAAFAALAGKNIRVLGFYRNQGEADANMATATYQTALTQLYADLTADNFFTSETKIVEVATPTTNDTGTPVSYGPELAAKQAFVNVSPSNRFLLDAGAVALEHDEIHWNLATQYYYGYVRLTNLFFGTSVALPPSVQPPAPAISFNSSTSIVTVVPPGPVGAWPQKEFYYIMNGSAPKRLTTSFTFPIPAGVTANSGQVQVYSRAVPGRGQSAAALNPATWNGIATTNTINWRTASGRSTAQDSSGSTTRLYRMVGPSAWDAYAPADKKILAPPAGTTNAAPVATISIPNILATQAAIVCGVSTTPTIATKDNMFAGIYVDNANYSLMAPISGNAGNYISGAANSAVPQTGPLTLDIYTDRITLTNSTNQVLTYPCTPFTGGQTLYVQGIVYGMDGWSSGQQVSQIIGATLTGGTLTAF